MKKKTQTLNIEDDLLVNLTCHNIPESLLTEFTRKIAQPYYKGNLNAALQDLMHKALAEQDFVLNHISAIRKEL
jgi:hypothetical protein